MTATTTDKRNPRFRPLRTVNEVAAMMGLDPACVESAERAALEKLRNRLFKELKKEKLDQEFEKEFAASLETAIGDCVARPELNKARKIQIELLLVPSETEKIKFEYQVKTKRPTKPKPKKTTEQLELFEAAKNDK